MRTRVGRALGIAMLGVIACGSAGADELQGRLLVAMQASRAQAFAFQQTTAVDTTGQPHHVYVERYDPRRAAADRWSMVSVDGRAPTAKEVAKAREGKRGPVPSYAGLADWFGTPARRAEAPPGYVAYRFDRLPAGTFKIGSHDASADTQVEALVNVRGAAPFVERVRFVSTRGFRMMLIASVKSLDVTSRYVALPGGGVVPESFVSTMTGSLLGKAGQLKATVTFSSVQPVR